MFGTILTSLTEFGDMNEKAPLHDFHDEQTDCPLGNFIKEKRNSKGYSLRKLGEITGISFSHLSKIERGVFVPEKNTLDIISEALEVDRDELYLIGGYFPTDRRNIDTIKSILNIDSQLKFSEATSYIKEKTIKQKKNIFISNNYDSVLKTTYDIYRKLISDETLEVVLSKYYNELFAIPEDRKNEFFKILSKDSFDSLEEKEKDKLVEIFDLRNSIAHSEIASGLDESLNSVIITNTLSRSKNRIDEIMQRVGRGTRPHNNTINESDFIQIPIYGEIKAGYDFLGEQNVIGYEITSKSSISDGEYFYLKVKGDSMIDDGIIDGCKVLVRKQGHVENGKIGVVIVNGEEATLKRVFYDGDKIILQASNKSIPPKTFELNDVLIQGQVRSYVVDL